MQTFPDSDITAPRLNRVDPSTRVLGGRCSDPREPASLFSGYWVEQAAGRVSALAMTSGVGAQSTELMAPGVLIAHGV